LHAIVGIEGERCEASERARERERVDEIEEEERGWEERVSYECE